jgi:hypothetical protein
MPTTNDWNNQIAAANSAILLNSGTHGVNISTDAAATSVNIATGSGNKTLNLGSTNTTSTTNFQSGSGGINIPQFTEGALVTNSVGRVSSVTGAPGYVLTANTAGTAPSFQPSGSGSKVLIQTQTVSGVTNVDFVTGVTGYTYYVLECLQYFFTANSNQVLRIAFTSNAGGSWNAYTYNQFIQSNESDFAVFRALGVNASVAGTVINGFQGTILNAQAYGIVKFYGFASSSLVKQTTFSGTDLSNDAINREQLLGATSSVQTTAVNGIRIAQDTSAPTLLFSGTFRLFGVV